MNKTKIYALNVSVLLMTLASITGLALHKANQPRPGSVASSVIRGSSTCMYNDGAVCIPVNVQGDSTNKFSDPVIFAVDTGSFTTVIPQSLATRFNLVHGAPEYIVGFGGKESEGYFSSANLKIGDEIYQNVPCLVIPDEDTLGSPVLGIDFFRTKNLTLTMNAEKNTVSLATE